MSFMETRSRTLGLWFIGVALAAVAAFTFGPGTNGVTTALLLGVALVPPLLIRMLWAGDKEVTAADVLYGRS